MRWRSGADSAGSGGPPPPNRPRAPAGGSGLGASPPGSPQALPEPRRGRRLQRGRVRKWLLKHQQRLVGGLGRGAPCGCAAGSPQPVWRWLHLVTRGWGEVSGRIRPQLCVGEAAVSLPGVGVSRPFRGLHVRLYTSLPKQRLEIAAERRFLKQMEANLVLFHSGLHQPSLKNLPRVSEAKGFASVVPLLLSFSLTQ